MVITINGKRTWKKNPLFRKPVLRWVVLFIVLAYLVIAGRSFTFNWERMIMGLDRAGRIVRGFLHPDFVSRKSYIIEGILESLTMTLAASFLSLFLSVVLALGAAKNIAAPPVYFFSRLLLMIIRSLHTIVIGIIFVIILGFGPLAGVVTLMLHSIGFVGKLLAEDIENIKSEPLEAIRATGASWLQVVVYGVWPQISTRFIGLSIYRADINFRQSTVIGIVGAGGIGAVLDTAMGRYDYNTTAAILICIIVLVLIAEYISSAIRRKIV
ncbi:phosphonate ABC transporter, permease protein PhnE [Spirochaetia bacterium]|nr:phosphonate ABC transporter, permease protein PhnE [Spirochaetia bacterium]